MTAPSIIIVFEGLEGQKINDFPFLFEEFSRDDFRERFFKIFDDFGAHWGPLWPLFRHFWPPFWRKLADLGLQGSLGGLRGGFWSSF